MGSKVELITTDNEKIIGVYIEKDDEEHSICIREADGDRDIFFTDIRFKSYKVLKTSANGSGSGEQLSTPVDSSGEKTVEGDQTDTVPDGRHDESPPELPAVSLSGAAPPEDGPPVAASDLPVASGPWAKPSTVSVSVVDHDQEESFATQLERIRQATDLMFSGNDNALQLPTPNFALSEMEHSAMSKKDLEVVRNHSLSKYNSAKKIGDFSRLDTIIADVKKQILEYPMFPRLTLLCGLLMLKQGKESNLTVAGDYLKKSLEQNQEMDTLRGLAYLTMKQKKWNEAGEYLVRLLLATEVIDKQSFPEARALGYCLLNSPDPQLSGIVTLIDKTTPESLAMVRSILFLALKKNHPKAAVLLYEGKLAEARRFAPDSPVFQSAALLYPAPPEDQNYPTVNREAVSADAERAIGTVTFYPNRKIGFIYDASIAETFFFDEECVRDDELWKALLGGIQKIRVFYSDTGRRYSPDAKYTVAQNIEFASDNERQRCVLDMLPKQIKEPFSSTRPAFHSDSPQAIAKWMEQCGRLDEAELYFSKAIAMGSRAKTREAASAVMDLAALYNRREKFIEALSLLDEKQDLLADPDRIDNMKITILTKAKRYNETAEILTSMILRAKKSTLPEKKRLATLYQQKAYCFLRIALQENNEQLLTRELSPIISLLEKLRPSSDDALKAVRNMPQKLKDYLSLAAAAENRDEMALETMSAGIGGLKLPPVARFMLEQDDLENVEQRLKELVNNLESENSHDSVDRIKSEIDRLKGIVRTGGKRPLWKAKIHQNIASLYSKIPSSDFDDEIKFHICKALAFWGEGQVYDRNNDDYARVLLSESLEIRMTNPIYGLLLITYLQNMPDSNEIIQKQQRAIPEDAFLEYALRLFSKDEHAVRDFMKDLPSYFLRFSDHCQSLIDKAKSMKLNCFSELTKDNMESMRIEELHRFRQIHARLKTLQNSINSPEYNSYGLLADDFETLDRITDLCHFSLDKDRLNRTAQTARDLDEIGSYQDYFQIRRRLNEVKTHVNSIMEEIKEKPTAISLDYLLSMHEKIKTLIDRFEEDVKRKSVPRLIVSSPLKDDNYLLAEKNIITFPVSVELDRDNAPVEALEIKIEELDGLNYNKSTGTSPELLRGGESRTIEIELIPSAEQIKKEGFDVNVSIGYRIADSGENQTTKFYRFPIKIGKPGEPFPNPYDKGGAPVNNPNKFVGRHEVIAEVLKHIRSEAEGKCFMLYGQYRSGKTSTMKQIIRYLTKPYLPVETDISMGENSDATNLNFAHMVFDPLRKSLSKALTGNTFDPEIRHDFNIFFPYQQRTDSPVPTFLQMVDYTREKLASHGWEKMHVIFLIDEFTKIRDRLFEGKMSENIMQHWKTMMQQGTFSAVLIGQDTMPWILEKFPNDFGVIDKMRISYLSKEETRELADNWIALDGKSRYRGRAFDRLFELTAGNPYYTQRFCHQLVEHLNNRRAAVITEADIDAVCQQLCTPGNSGFIPGMDFHPLYLPQENQKDYSKDQFIALLRAVAELSKRTGKANPDLIYVEGLNTDDCRRIIEEMKSREILETEPGSTDIRIRVRLYAEWLRNNR